MTQNELKLVFDALQECTTYAVAGGFGKRATAHRDALDILEKALAQEEALAQPEQKCPNLKNCNGACFQCEYFNVETGEMEYPVAQPEQEPWCMKMNGCKTKCEDCPDEPPDICCQQYDTCLKSCTPRGVHLAQRTWAGLTDVEIDYLLGSTVGENEETHISFARAIEAKLKLKNG